MSVREPLRQLCGPQLAKVRERSPALHHTAVSLHLSAMPPDLEPGGALAVASQRLRAAAAAPDAGEGFFFATTLVSVDTREKTENATAQLEDRLSSAATSFTPDLCAITRHGAALGAVSYRFDGRTRYALANIFGSKARAAWRDRGKKYKNFVAWATLVGGGWSDVLAPLVLHLDQGWFLTTVAGSGGSGSLMQQVVESALVPLRSDPLVLMVTGTSCSRLCKACARRWDADRATVEAPLLHLDRIREALRGASTQQLLSSSWQFEGVLERVANRSFTRTLYSDLCDGEYRWTRGNCNAPWQQPGQPSPAICRIAPRGTVQLVPFPPGTSGARSGAGHCSLLRKLACKVDQLLEGSGLWTHTLRMDEAYFDQKLRSWGVVSAAGTEV